MKWQGVSGVGSAVSPVACRVAVLMLAGAALLSGCEWRPEPRSLKDMESRMTVRDDAPQSRMVLLEQNGDGANRAWESSFRPAGEDSVFRAAEVAPDRLAETETLLSELKAREMPDRSIRFDLPADILFDFDKADLRPDAAQALEKAARLISAYERAPLGVVGHTDAKGDDPYNDRLSLRRAETVAAWLKEKIGRDATVKGMGERQPVAANAHPDGSDDPQARQRNRRVEISLLLPPA